MESATAASRPVSPVDRAFHVLQVVVAAREPLGVREIGRRSGLPRSTASRLVASLEQLGMVERTADALVAPGSALATLQPTSANTPMLLRDQLRPLLAEVSATFGENAGLAIDDTDALLYLDQAVSENPVSVDDVAGERHAFHLVAPGVLTMASWGRDRLDAFLASHLESVNDYSITDPKTIRKRLQRVRSDGYAWTNQELDIGINGVAVGVYDADNQLVATLSVYGPSYRLSPTERPDLAIELLALVQHRAPTLLGK